MNSYNASQYYHSASGPSRPRQSSSPTRVPRHSHYDTVGQPIPSTSTVMHISSSSAGPSRAYLSQTSRESRRHQPYRSHFVNNNTENYPFSTDSTHAPQMPQTAGGLYERRRNYNGSLSSSRRGQEFDAGALATITNNVLFSEVHYSRGQAGTFDAAVPQIEAHAIGPLGGLYEPAYAVAGSSAPYSQLENLCFDFNAYESVASVTQAETTDVSVHVHHEEQLIADEGLYYNLTGPAPVENPWNFEAFVDIGCATEPVAGPSSPAVQTPPQFSPPPVHYYFERPSNATYVSAPTAFPPLAPTQPILQSSPAPTHHHCAITEVHFVAHAHAHAVPAPTTSFASPPEAESSIKRAKKRTWSPPAGTSQIPCEWDGCGELIFFHPRSVADHVQEKHLGGNVTDKKDQVKACKWGKCASKGYKLESLKRHMAGHLKTAEAACPHCGQILSRADARKRHVNTCRKCGVFRKEFDTPKDLAEHSCSWVPQS